MKQNQKRFSMSIRGYLVLKKLALPLVQQNIRRTVEVIRQVNFFDYFAQCLEIHFVK